MTTPPPPPPRLVVFGSRHHHHRRRRSPGGVARSVSRGMKCITAANRIFPKKCALFTAAAHFTAIFPGKTQHGGREGEEAGWEEWERGVGGAGGGWRDLLLRLLLLQPLRLLYLGNCSFSPSSLFFCWE